MSRIYGYEDYCADAFLAASAIGALLRESKLMLLLGAGASAGFGLPEWGLFVARLLGVDGDQDKVRRLEAANDKELGRRIDEIDNATPEYVDGIHAALYREVEQDLLDQLVRSPLLLAVAALITGQARGRIDIITTYNYDDLLEQYLGMLGYSVIDLCAMKDI